MLLPALRSCEVSSGAEWERRVTRKAEAYGARMAGKRSGTAAETAEGIARLDGVAVPGGRPAIAHEPNG